MTAAGDSLDFFQCFLRLDISCESSARQMIHMQHQALSTLKDKCKKIKVSTVAILHGSLIVNSFIEA